MDNKIELKELEIIVDDSIIKVKKFLDYAGENKFYAIAHNGNLYYNNNNGEKYELLKENFTQKTTPPQDQFGIVEYDRKVENKNHQ